MKITVVIQAFNAINFLGPAIKSALHIADDMVIIWGPQVEFMAMFPEGEGTSMFLNNIVDMNENVHLVTPPNEMYWGNEIIQRNAYLEEIKKLNLNPDWIFQIDADECYWDAHLDRLRVLGNIFLKKPVTMITFPHIHFWRDMTHVIEGGGWKHPMMRFIKYTEDLLYHDVRPQPLDNIGNKDNVSLWGTEYVFDKRVWCYHYGHAYPRYKYLEKLIGSNLRDAPDNPEKSNLLKMTREEVGEWIISNHKWFQPNWMGDEETGEKVVDFPHTHPYVKGDIFG